MIREADPLARAGDAVAVYDRNARFRGRGWYNPGAAITLRMLTDDDTPIDDAFWMQRLRSAVSLRHRLGIEELTDAYRMVHAEGDGLSGLIAERYADCLVLEVFALAIHQRRFAVARALADVLGAPASLDRPGRKPDHWRIVFRADERIERAEGFSLPTRAFVYSGRSTPSRAPMPTPSTAAGGAKAEGPAEASGEIADGSPVGFEPIDLPPPVTIREHGLRFRVDVAAGHKTGFFCDQRDNRRRFAGLCGGSRVLDVCCYTAGFGVAAKVLGGADDVTSVDLDEEALRIARENVHLNQTRVHLVHADAFIYLRQMIANSTQYEAVVVDPPKFVANRAELDAGMRKYLDLNHLAIQVVRPGGVLLTCCCSGSVSVTAFEETVHRAARRAGRCLQCFDRTGPAPDHPVMMDCPESSYFKSFWFRVL
jgi:23S rRNA (cytosine1962-C5)-methyltransferase